MADPGGGGRREVHDREHGSRAGSFVRGMGWGAFITIGALVGLALIAVFVATNTSFGHERVRRFVVSFLEEQLLAQVTIGDIDGNLLSGAVLENVAIADTSGDPFAVVDRALVRYDLWPLLTEQRIEITALSLVSPLVIFSEQPGGEWNIARIIPPDTTPEVEQAPGFGDWIDLRNVVIREGRIIVRSAWSPEEALAELEGEALDSALAVALDPGNRPVVEEVPGGYQEVTVYADVDARIPRIRIADPDSAGILARVASLDMVATPFGPPPVRVQELSGTVLYVDDTLLFENVNAELPNTVLAGSGMYLLEPGVLRLDILADTFALADLQWLYPTLPARGGGSGAIELVIRDDAPDVYRARNTAIRIGDSRIAGAFGLTVYEGDSVRFEQTALRFEELDPTLLAQTFEWFPALPIEGRVTGTLDLDGTLSALELAANLYVRHPRTGLSHVLAEGQLGVVGEALETRGLRVQLAPLQVDLLQQLVAEYRPPADGQPPVAPLTGELRGIVTLEGSTARTLEFRADLVHDGRVARSAIDAAGAVRLVGTEYVSLRAQLEPLSLATVGQLVPVELRGEVAGSVVAEGTFEDIDLVLDLELPAGGTLVATGSLGIAGPRPTYAIEARTHIANLDAIAPALPSTSITGTLAARGAGLDPATMDAAIAANLVNTVVDTVPLERAFLEVVLEDGLLAIDTALVAGPGAQIVAEGTFGLEAGRVGELAYIADIDSLGAFERWIPLGDTAAAVADAGPDAAVDEADAAPDTVNQVAPVADDPVPLAGSFRAAGTVRGNIERFALRGRAASDGIIIGSSRIGQARATYAVVNGGTAQANYLLAANLDSLAVTALSIDSAGVRLSWSPPGGQAVIAVWQDTATDYRASAEFLLGQELSTVRLADLSIRMDTVAWVSARPATIAWGGEGIRIDSLLLQSTDGGRIFADGVVRPEGVGNLRLSLEQVQIAHWLALLQTDIDAQGIVFAEGALSGTAERPNFAGRVAVASARYEGVRIPDIRATAAYDDRSLRAEGWATHLGDVVARFDATVPVDLTLGSTAGPRLLPQPLAVNLAVDSVPLDVFGELTDAIDRVRGTAEGVIAIRGTPRDPEITGMVDVNIRQFLLAATGVMYRNVVGRLQLADDVLRIVRLDAQGGGPVLVEGTVNLATLTRPVFDLSVITPGLLVLNNARGELYASANIDITGPLQRVLVSGRATALRGTIYPDVGGDPSLVPLDDRDVYDVLDTALTTPSELIPEQFELLDYIILDLTVAVSRNVWVRSGDYNVEIYTLPGQPLTVEADLGTSTIIVDGSVFTQRGEYEFVGRRFEIARGTIVFIGDPQINPLLNLTAEQEVPLPAGSPLTIRVVVGGTLRTPMISLESTAQPPIPESDLLAYLTLGRPSTAILPVENAVVDGGGGNLVGNVAAQATQQLAAIALGALVEEVESDLQRALAADVINISPAALPTAASAGAIETWVRGTQIELGRYVSRQTFVALEGRITTAALPGIRVEHQLGRGFVLIGSYTSRFVVQQPRLGDPLRLDAFNVLGAALRREWRY